MRVCSRCSNHPITLSTVDLQPQTSYQAPRNSYFPTISSKTPSRQTNDLLSPSRIPAPPRRPGDRPIFLPRPLRSHPRRLLRTHRWTIHGTDHQRTGSLGVHKLRIPQGPGRQSGRRGRLPPSDGPGERGGQEGRGHAGRFRGEGWGGGDGRDDDAGTRFSVWEVGSGRRGRGGRALIEALRQVPDGHCWVLGDNLPESRDSRFYGPVPLALVKGKVIAKVLPWSDMGWIENNLKQPEEP